ncbi:MAG: glycogen-binding domain-containing protein [Longimicrobiales bacterium]
MMRGVVTVCLLLVSSSALAQQTMPVPPLPSLSEMLGQPATLSVIPSLGWISPGARSALDARLFWPGRVDRDFVAQLGLEFGGARFDLQSYVRSAIDLRLMRKWTGFAPWLGGAVGVGGGAGPRTVYQVSAGGESGMLGLAVRTSWFDGVPAPRDSIATPAESNVALRRRHTDAELTATHRLGPVLTSLTAGSRFGSYQTQRSWAFGTITIPVRDRVGISLASGWRPEQPERAQPGGAFAQISLRFDVRSNEPRRTLPGMTGEEELSLSAAPLATGFQLRVRARAAQSVQLKGDLSDWEIRDFRPATDGFWELQIEVPAGVYKINIRIDGRAWMVPTGMMAIPDGFGGTAGLLNLY